MDLLKAQAKTVLSWAGIICLNVYFWIFFLLGTLILACIAIPYQYLFSKVSGNQRRSEWLIRRIITKYGHAVIHFGWPLVRVRYIDCVPDDKPPFVIVVNHRSTSDAFLTAFLPFECVQVLNVWTSRLPLVNYLSRTGKFLRVREIPFEEFLRQGLRLLAEGCSVIAFPEGTRSGSKKLGPFHGAAFRLAQQAGVKICPMTISGSENIPKRGSLLMHPGRIVVTKLPSLAPEQWGGMSAYALKMRVRDTIGRHLETHDEETPHLEAQPV